MGLHFSLGKDCYAPAPTSCSCFFKYLQHLSHLLCKPIATVVKCITFSFNFCGVLLLTITEEIARTCLQIILTSLRPNYHFAGSQLVYN